MTAIEIAKGADGCIIHLALRASLARDKDSDDRKIAMKVEGQVRASRLEMRDLRRIVVLARMRSFTRAAERLGISQSVLTRSIKEIEQRVGLRLFDRDRGGVHVAVSAQTIIEQAAELLRDFDDFSKSVERISVGDAGQIKFGLAPSAAFALLPQICAQIASRNANLETYIPVRQPESLLRLLLDEQIELLICPDRALDDDSGTRVTKLGYLSLSLLVRPGHPALESGYGPVDEGYPALAEVGKRPSILTPTKFTDYAPFPPYFMSHLIGAQQIVVEDHQCLALIAELSDAIWIAPVLTGMQAIKEKHLLEIVPPPGQERPRVLLVAHALERRSLSPPMASILRQIPMLLRALPEEQPL